MREAFGAFGDEHHVRAIFQNFAGEADGIANALQRGDRAGAERGAVHDDGVAFDAAVEIQMRAEAGVENRIVFEDDDGGFDGVESRATGWEDRPAGVRARVATGLAGWDGVIGNVPGATVNDERRFHRQGEWQRGSLSR